jgi:hypothetical protein
MSESISGNVSYNDLQQFAYLNEGNLISLLTIDVKPFNQLNPQDARYAYNYLKQKQVAPGGAIQFQGRRVTFNGSDLIIITQPF